MSKSSGVERVGVIEAGHDRPVRPARRGRTTGNLVRVEILFLLALSLVTLVAVIRLAGEVSNTRSTSPQPLPRGLVWGGRTFVDLKSFAQWLHVHGGRYEAWALNHRHRAGLPALPEPQPAQEARGESRSRGWVIAAGGLAFVVCAGGAWRRRRRAWSLSRRSKPARAMRAGQKRQSVWAAAVDRTRAAGGGTFAAVAGAARATGRVTSPERAEPIPGAVDWGALAERAARAVGRSRRRVASPSPELLWYSAATLLAGAMGAALAFWG